MYLPLTTIDVWCFEGEFTPAAFLRALGTILREGDIVLFGAYEPSPFMVEAFRNAPAVMHQHLPAFGTCFDANRSDHPHGCAFEYRINGAPFADLLALDPSLFTQNDVAGFYDHVVAYRPGCPELPLLSFHDARTGGALYLSGHYTKEELQRVEEALGFPGTAGRNPELNLLQQP